MSAVRRHAPALLSATCFVALIAYLLAAALWRPLVEVRHVELVVTDLGRSRQFFEGLLMFTPVSVDHARFEATLRLGDEFIRLRQRDLPIPLATRPANEIHFQHLAIVVSDIDDAYKRLVAGGVTTISPGPVTLPASNRDIDGIRALYFRDPDGHFLELIEFPPDKGEPRWQNTARGPFLGIDHTAIVVRSTDTSVPFYRDSLGLTVVGRSFNRGPEQEALSGVAGAYVRVSSLRCARGPGIELLEYQRPGLVANVGETTDSDWRISLRSNRNDEKRADPDDHRLQLLPSLTNRLLGAKAAFIAHWKRYLMEAAELGVFMIVTLWLTLLLEHPLSPARRRLQSALLRRVLMGAAIGSTVVVLINSTWGTQSGAHFNPAVTLSYLHLGRIDAWDAFFYVIAQFVGGWIGATLAALPFRRAVAHPAVAYAATLPKKGGVSVTLAAEFAISFALLATLLLVQQQPALKSHIAYFAGALLLLYITFESPISGMSLNPARTVASAVAARGLAGVWPYFVAPVAGMLAAAFCFGN